MPNIKSAAKRVKVSATKKLQNQMIRSQMQTAVKKFNAAISEGNVELAKTLLPVASSQIDEAAKKNVIHKNAANRKKSQIAKALSQLERGIVVVKVDFLVNRRRCLVVERFEIRLRVVSVEVRR